MSRPVIALDAHGVLLPDPNLITSQLIPSVRALGGTAPDEVIAEAYYAGSRGELDSAGVWARIGVAGDDVTYCARYRVADGMEELLLRLRAEGYTVVALTNDVSEWSALIRHALGLDRLITTWVVSADIGARKPDPAAYAALIAAVPGVTPADIWFFDDKRSNVEAAEAAGLTAFLHTGPETIEAALAA
jgi:HAD superfamily hydrolase (TIGR01509 family)